MKSLRLLLAALVIVTAFAHEKKKKFDRDELIDDLLERTGEVTHEIYAFEEKLDARMDPDRIRRAGSLMHRVEELEDPKCKEHEHSCGGYDHQCISHLLFCDGHKDCRNGDDEKDCILPTKAGDHFIGDVVFDECTKRKPEHITLVIESVETAAFFTGFPKLHVHMEIESHHDDDDDDDDDDDHHNDHHDDDDDEDEESSSLPADGHYSFGDHLLFIDAPEDDGLGLRGEFDGHNFDRFVGDIIHTSSDEPCARFIFHRDEDRDGDHDNDDDDHDDDDDDDDHDDHHDKDHHHKDHHHKDHHGKDHHDKDHHDKDHHDKDHHGKDHHGKDHHGKDDHHVEHHGKKGHY